MGQIQHIGRSISLKRWANASIFSAAILAAYVGLHGSLMQQLIACPMAHASPLPIGPCERLHAISLQADLSPLPVGPCKGLHDISYRLLSADLSPSVGAIHSKCGPLRAFCGSHPSCPHISFMQQLIVGSMGQCKGLHEISYRLLLANSSPSVEAIYSKCGPLQAFCSSHPSCPYRPTQQFHTAAHCRINRP